MLLAIGKPNWMAATNATKAVVRWWRACSAGTTPGRSYDPGATSSLWLYPFAGALVGVVASDMLRYLTSAVAVDGEQACRGWRSTR